MAVAAICELCACQTRVTLSSLCRGVAGHVLPFPWCLRPCNLRTCGSQLGSKPSLSHDFGGLQPMTAASALALRVGANFWVPSISASLLGSCSLARSLKEWLCSVWFPVSLQGAACYKSVTCHCRNQMSLAMCCCAQPKEAFLAWRQDKDTLMHKHTCAFIYAHTHRDTHRHTQICSFSLGKIQ